VPFVKDYSVPDGNTFVWDKKILLAQDSTIAIEATGNINLVICGMLL